MLSVPPSSNTDTSSWAAGKRRRMEACAGQARWAQILEAAAARKGSVWKKDLAEGAASAWCSLRVRKLCFRGACSMRAGSEAEQRAG